LQAHYLLEHHLAEEQEQQCGTLQDLDGPDIHIFYSLDQKYASQLDQHEFEHQEITQ